MKFGNVALYCKGWYKIRNNNVKTMWMDMLHCINADGWSLWSKHDVVEWCMHRLDNLREDENFPHKNQLDLTYFWKEINGMIRRDEWYYHEGIDYEDAIILHYRNIISNLEGKYFNEMFPNHEEQEIKDGEFEYQEGWIRGKNWEDVVVLIGSDSLLDCEEVEVSGELLCNSGNIRFKDDDFLDLNIYEHCVNFDKNKKYLCRVKKEIEHWSFGDDVKYKLMSILNEV